VFSVISEVGIVHAQTDPPMIPLTPGLTFVLAVHAPKPAAAGSHIAQGDYEMVVTIAGVSPSGIDESTRIEAVDESRKPIQVTIRRRVLTADLANSRLQILGFHTDDPSEIAGTTSLGPSMAIMRDLRTNARATYSVRNFKHLSTSTGTLTLAGSQPVPFPVLLNGQRVELPALRVTGQLKYNDKVRPWEQYLLDHPQHPITLRFAHGAVDEGIPFKPETIREVVRIDFPALNDHTMEDALSKLCRVEVPGIYFDFDRATLNPQSTPALTAIADLLRRQPQWRLSIEGHTDNIGSDSYNQDLSTRRAAAVNAALVHDFAVVPERLSSAGFGERRPVEPNDTIAGRARNRRVELVRDCSGKR
jgi:outer membrane protein OmpA-like peptidoglycan-associated protein